MRSSKKTISNLSVLLSIKPEFVKQIASGSKQYEFRRVIFKQKVEKVYIYSTSPVKKIVGYFIIEDVICDNPTQLWAQCNLHGGIDKDAFFEYFSGKEEGYAIKIGDVVLFDIPLDPYKKNSMFVAPQSFSYLPAAI